MAAKPFGRFALCGMISHYNDTDLGEGVRGLVMAVGKSLTLRGFIVSNHADMQADFASELAGWVAAGKFKSARDGQGGHRERAGRLPGPVQGREPRQDAGEARLTACARA